MPIRDQERHPSKENALQSRIADESEKRSCPFYLTPSLVSNVNVYSDRVTGNFGSKPTNFWQGATFMDKMGSQWTFEVATVSSGNPNNLTVEIKKRDIAFDISCRNYINLQG